MFWSCRLGWFSGGNTPPFVPNLLIGPTSPFEKENVLWCILCLICSSVVMQDGGCEVGRSTTRRAISSEEQPSVDSIKIAVWVL